MFFFLFSFFFFETKNRDSRKLISQNLFNFSIRENLSHEISSICQIAKVYPKKFEFEDNLKMGYLNMALPVCIYIYVS